MKKLLMLMFLIIFSLKTFASVESNIKAKRFQYKNETLIDNFTGLQWQDNKAAKTNEYYQNSMKNGCPSSLDGKDDWRLPSISELKYAYQIKHKFKNKVPQVYWSDTKHPVYGEFYKLTFNFYNASTDIKANGLKNKHYVRCVRGKKFNSLDEITNKIHQSLKLKMNHAAKKSYKLAQKKNTISSYQLFINKYPKSKQVKYANENINKLIYKSASQLNTISGYKSFVLKHPNNNFVQKAKKNIIDIATTNTTKYNKSIILNYPHNIKNINFTKIFNLIDEFNIETKKKVIINQIIKPTKPTETSYYKMNITKGEFEKSKAYNTRKKIEENRIKQLNKNIDAQYLQDIKEYQLETIKAEKKYKDTIKAKPQQNKILYDRLRQDVTKEYIKQIVYNAENNYKDTKITSFKYNADEEVFDIVLELKNTNKNVKAPVPIKYAKKFKDIMTANNFKPTFKYIFKNQKLNNILIKEIQNPEQLIVEKDIYNKAKGSKLKLKQFIKRYPDSGLVTIAQQNIENILKEEEKERQRKAEEYIRLLQEQQQAKKEKQERAKWTNPKYRGDRVCMDGRVAIFISITIKAYVENVDRSRIQIRISDTEGQSPRVNGETLYRGKIIWDNANNWYKCN